MCDILLLRYPKYFVKGAYMSESELITPNSLYVFYEQKKEQAITKEEENFFKEVFRYTLRMVNGLSCSINKNSLNQRAIAHTACAWLVEYQEFKKNYNRTNYTSANSRKKKQEDDKDNKKTVIMSNPNSKPIPDFSADVASLMTSVRNGSVHTTDDKYSILKKCYKEAYNDKKRR